MSAVQKMLPTAPDAKLLPLRLDMRFSQQKMLKKLFPCTSIFQATL